MANKYKEVIKTPETDISIDIFNDKVINIIEILQSYVIKYGDSVWLELDYQRDRYDDSTYYYYNVKYRRVETEEERLKRLEQNRKLRAKRKKEKKETEQKEYAEYLKLKQKFEK